MKGIKIFLGVVTFLLIIAIGFSVYVWYTLQSLQTVAPMPTPEGTTPIEQSEPTAGEANPSAPAPIVIEKSDMSASQQKALETLGFTQDSFTITPTMITCAESAVGKTRLDEITAGAAPTPLESVKLLPCFKK